MFQSVVSTADHVRSLRWKRWPDVLETQQLFQETLDPLMIYICRQEQSVVEGCGRMERLSKPFSQPRKVTFYRTGASTRTEATFREAAELLGYRFRAVQGDFSSAVKGESARYSTMAQTQTAGMGPLRLSDIYIVRSNEEFAAHHAAETIEHANHDGHTRLPLPVINAGDGTHQHPTQALVDLASIYRERSCSGDDGCRHSLDDLTLMVTGDAKHSRTVNSLCYLLGKFARDHRITILFCTHPKLGPRKRMRKYLKKHNVSVELREDFKKCIREASVVYMTRIPREWFGKDKYSQRTYKEARQRYVFREGHMDLLRPDAFVLHPLPVNEDPLDPPPEIDPELLLLALRGHKQCAWARQSMRGVLVRAILFDLIEAGLQKNPQYGRRIEFDE